MAKESEKSSEQSVADCNFQLLQVNPNIRALTEAEIKILARALGRPIDRDYLVYWMSRSIGDIAKLSTLPSVAQCRDEYLRIVLHGRNWLKEIEQCRAPFLIRQHFELEEFKTKVKSCCDVVEEVAQRELGVAIKSGHPRSPALRDAFLRTLLGIAKRARVFPSTPSRAPQKPSAVRRPSAFFEFVIEALKIARDVIASSPLPDRQKAAALTILRVQSNEALSKQLERLRGRIGDYRDTPLGLNTWNRDAKRGVR
jgi:hypothetical protein